MTVYRKTRSILLLVALIGGAWLLQRWFMAPDVIQINGQAINIIDGDSFRSANDEFRIHGIDAPEFRQTCQRKDGSDWPCGREARQKLSALLGTSAYQCEVRARDRFGRAIVVCEDETGNDLGSAMVASGMALSGQNFDEVIYARQEAGARQSELGLWQGSFEQPEKWRDRHPR